MQTRNKKRRTIGRLTASLLMAGVACLPVAWGLPAGAQTVPDLDPANCFNGLFVTDPAANPELAADCRELTTIRNHWTRHPDNAGLPDDHPLRTWGSGDTVNITTWDRINVGNRVTTLALYNLSIAGTIPTEIGDLTGLVTLWLNDNQLTGPIPSTIGNLVNLRDFQVPNNMLTGRIPSEIGKLAKLDDLRLFPNDFTATANYLPDHLQERYERLFDSDELGLIAKADIIRNLTVGKAEWEVWVCQVGGPLNHNVESIARSLNQRITPYFSWLSEGRYTPVFIAKGVVKSPNKDDCDETIDSSGRNINRQAIIVEDTTHAGGVAVGYPGQPGSAIVGGGSVTAIPGRTPYTPRFSTIAHEMGHLLDWPHNYSGLDRWPNGGLFEAGNPMDIMSSPSDAMDLGSGTIAVNRYASGWIDPDDVIIHSGAATYDLSPVGTTGYQMLVIPSNDNTGVFYTLGARVQKDYDRGNPVSGVEVYLIDQRPSVCRSSSSQSDGVCWGTDRRVQPFPPRRVGINARYTYHVHGAGDMLRVGGFRIEISERRGDRFTVVVGEGCGGYFEGRFCDEDGSAHEDNIEQIAEWGITLGCGDDRFCPERSITRSQMAAFLHRTVARQSGTPAPATGVQLEDVPQDAWYRAFAEWAVASGVMPVPDENFRPEEAVTRSDMAQMMTAAFDNLAPSEQAAGLFVDMQGQTEEAVRAAEGLRAAGVTQGCSVAPLRYCPDGAVTRAQMASFFVRALGPRIAPG